MHNIKDIRKNLDLYKKKIAERNASVDFDELISLDKKNRDFILEKETREQEKKILSKSKDEKNFEKSKILSKEIEDISNKQIVLQNKINAIISNIPNIAHDDVPHR